jgi:hypothetical protein
MLDVRYWILDKKRPGDPKAAFQAKNPETGSDCDGTPETLFDKYQYFNSLAVMGDCPYIYP